MTRIRGRIVRVVRDRGFCFLRSDETREEYFVPARAFTVSDAISRIEVGDAVTFQEGKNTGRGLRAAKVVVL